MKNIEINENDLNNDVENLQEVVVGSKNSEARPEDINIIKEVNEHLKKLVKKGSLTKIEMNYFGGGYKKLN